MCLFCLFGFFLNLRGFTPFFPPARCVVSSACAQQKPFLSLCQACFESLSCSTCFRLQPWPARIYFRITFFPLHFISGLQQWLFVRLGAAEVPWLRFSSPRLCWCSAWRWAGLQPKLKLSRPNWQEEVRRCSPSVLCSAEPARRSSVTRRQRWELGSYGQLLR